MKKLKAPHISKNKDLSISKISANIEELFLQQSGNAYLRRKMAENDLDGIPKIDNFFQNLYDNSMGNGNATPDLAFKYSELLADILGLKATNKANVESINLTKQDTFVLNYYNGTKDK